VSEQLTNKINKPVTIVDFSIFFLTLNSTAHTDAYFLFRNQRDIKN